MKLTGAQKTKWLKLKAEIIKRPFIAFTAKLTEIEVQSLLSDYYPNTSRIEEISNFMRLDREKKTERLRPILAKEVGFRGSIQFANKIGISDGTIRSILNKKYKLPPSYDIISDIEIYLSYTKDFPISIENANIAKAFVKNKIDVLKEDTIKIADALKSSSQYFNDLKFHDKKIKKKFPNAHSDKWKISNLKNILETALNGMERIKFEVDNLSENFLE